MTLKMQLIVDEKLLLFKGDEFHSELRNHALRGKYLGFRSIDINVDLRALYKKIDGLYVLFAFLGTHSDLYE
jgi:addiction module RelE/StbE family toxin